MPHIDRMIGSEAVLTTVKQVVRRKMVMNLVKHYSFKILDIAGKIEIGR